MSEPRFRVGDWIVWRHADGAGIHQIVGIDLANGRCNIESLRDGGTRIVHEPQPLEWIEREFVLVLPLEGA